MVFVFQIVPFSTLQSIRLIVFAASARITAPSALIKHIACRVLALICIKINALWPVHLKLTHTLENLAIFVSSLASIAAEISLV